MTRLEHNWFFFLSSEKMKKLDDFFAEEPNNFMPHQLSVVLGTDLPTSLAVIAVLRAKKLINVDLLVYHQCDPGTPLEARPLNTGFPQLPWYCEECDTEVESYSELSFDLIAKLIV